MKEQIAKRIAALVNRNYSYSNLIRIIENKSIKSDYDLFDLDAYRNSIGRNKEEISFLESLINQPTKIASSELLPSHYREIKEPSYRGVGEHSVYALEGICETYKSLVHQLRIREQNLIKLLDLELE